LHFGASLKSIDSLGKDLLMYAIQHNNEELV